MSVPTFELARGYTISRLVRGGWQLAGDHGAVDGTRAIADMAEFPRAGVTTFDCADIYTGVEAMIGAFRADYGHRYGRDALAQVKIHTKYAPDADSLPVTRAQARAIVTRSLQRLGQERLDLVQFHWWRYEVEGAVETALWLQEFVAEGLIDRLGVTNFDTPNLAAILDAGVPLIASQNQYSLLDRRPENGLQTLMARHGMGLLCYGVLAGGFLTGRWLGAPDPDLAAIGNRSLVKYRLVIEEFGGWEPFQALLRLLDGIATRHGVPLSAVAMRWVLDRPGVAGVIIGARYARHLPDNLAAFAFSLDDSDRAAIDAFLATRPGPGGDTFALERDRTGRHGRIMKYNLNAGVDRIG